MLLPYSIPIKEQMIDWWGPVINEYYAGSEGNGFVAINSEQWLSHKGSVGQSLLSPVHIVGENGEVLPPGESGTIYFEGVESLSISMIGKRQKNLATRMGGPHLVMLATSTKKASCT